MRRRDEKFPENGFEAWGGYMQAKIAKLEEQFCVSAGKEEALSDIFNGVSIYVNGFTVPSADELKVLMSKHGGTYHTYQRSDDYIIASNLPDTKVKNMNLSRVVKPEWITDCLKSNRLLDYREYLLFKNSRTQRQLNFSKVIKNNDSIPATSKVPDVKNEPDSFNKNLIENSNIIFENEPSMQDVLPTESELDMKKSSNLHVQTVSKAHSGPVTKTAADPNFIAEFYNNSRLHHISQLGACFKQHINDLRENSNFQFPARVQLKEKILNSNNFNTFTQLKFEKNKVIMHIDMDCFFVSVGLRSRPELRGKPVAVTHSKGGQGRPKREGVDRHAEFNLYKQKQIKKFSMSTGKPENEVVIETRIDSIGDENEKYGSMSEIASCSYEAREKGLGNGMFMGAALKLCPDLQTIPYDFDGYKEVAYTLYNTIAQYTLDVEAVSCDEMYVDCTELLADMKVNVQSFATMLREEIKNKTGCPCSTGFGGNRLQARLATKRAKPDGQFFLTEDLVEDFIYEIKLRDLPGVGRQTAQKLEALGHITCGSLQSLSLASLKSQLGNKTGAQLFDQCRGRDQHPLSFLTVRKSVSAEVNYGIRFENSNQCIDFLKQLSAEVHSRMQQFKVVGKCITLKLMVRDEEAPVETAKFMGHGFCNVINKSTTLNKATNDVEVITKEVLAICKKQNIDPKEMRGIGIQVTKLEPLNSKPSKGTINKFLANNIKSEIKTESTASEGVSVISGRTIEKRTPTKVKKVISTKSPLGKRRGRPPKSLKLLQSSTRNVGPSKSVPSTSKNLPSTSKKVMNNFLQGQNAPRDLPYKNPMIKESLPKEEPPVKKEPKGMIGLPWKTVRDMLRAWLNSDQSPLQYDVNMIVEYLQEMILTKDIEHLFILMNFLRRVTREVGSDVWLKVYDSIYEQVQNMMVAVYGKKLHVFDD
ncbi:unnamed protein product [Chrysodeixis includens]|uniref:DNA repair protein REV1 n=1 Tax=Chrysodeixis includens TaxID=689277 RepID=A0A9N8KTL9_CHRIL|nr:unnamed protein product [Chrysodeixis includens]